METVAHRLSKFIDYLDIAPTKFEKQIDVGHSTIMKAINQSKSIGSDIINKILITYPELSAEWLMRGEGEMIIYDNSEILNNSKSHIINGNNKSINGDITVNASEHKTLIGDLEFLRGQIIKKDLQIDKKDEQISFLQGMLNKLK